MKQLVSFWLVFFLCIYVVRGQEATLKHTVTSGQTLADIAQKYNVDAEDIKQLNPSVVNGIKKDDVLFIPESKDLKKQSIKYTVKSGDTKYSLAKNFGISISELENQNPQIVSMLMTGEVLVINGKGKKLPTVQSNQEKTDPQPISSYTSPSRRSVIKSSSSHVDLKQTIVASKKKRVMFFLPFSKSEFAEDKMSADNLSEYLKNNRDFYRGALMAIDSASVLGLNFEFDVIKTGATKLSSDFVKMADSANIESYDAVILPFYHESAQDIAAAVSQYNIPVVTTGSVYVNKETPNLYEAIPSINAQRKTMLDFILSRGESNLIVISEKSRTESQDFISSIAPEARYVYLRESGSLNSEDLIGVLEKHTKNYVILDSDKQSVFISATNTLLREMSNHSIQLAVLESSLIPNEQMVSRNRFVILDMLYPSLTDEESSVKNNSFDKLYQKHYFSEPVAMSAYGFDITFDTLLRLFQTENFEKIAEKMTIYDSLKFHYSKNDWGYYSNLGVSIFQFEPNDMHSKVK